MLMNFLKNLFNGLVYTANVADLNERATTAESNLAAAKARVNSLETENAILKSEATGRSRELSQIQEQIAEYKDRISDLEARQMPPRENGRFVSSKKQAALPEPTKSKKAKKLVKV